MSNGQKVSIRFCNDPASACRCGTRRKANGGFPRLTSLAYLMTRMTTPRRGKCATLVWGGFQNAESVPRRRGKVSKTRKVCHGGVARFPKRGKCATEAWGGFQNVESMPRKRGEVSKTWKVCHGGVGRFPRRGKCATEAWGGFQNAESVPRRREEVSKTWKVCHGSVAHFPAKKQLNILYGLH